MQFKSPLHLVLASMTDSEVERLYARILRNIRHAKAGGTVFGLDLRTIWAQDNNLGEAMTVLAEEIKARRSR